MKIIGDKIYQARIIRGKSITELADILGVTKQSVFQYENNLSEPKNEIIFKLIFALGFPASFFTIPYENHIERTNTFFRALLSASKIEKMSLAERTTLVAYFYDFLNRYLDLPQLKLPEIDEKIIDEKNYDGISIIVRNYWELKNKPILNMVNLLEDKGIVITTIKVPDKKIDAFTQTHNKKVLFCIMLEDTKNSMVRRNFTLAHELGHIILHSSLNFDELEKERKIEIEREADNFAASLLLPKEEFCRDLQYPNDLDFYIKLKQKWYVSIFAMIMRAKALNLINEKSYISLIKKYNYRKYRFNEPLDNAIPIKNPILFEQSIKMLLDNDILTIDSLLSEMATSGLALNLNDIVKFFALEDSFFDPYIKRNINISIKPSLKQD